MMKMQLVCLWLARMHAVHPGKPGPGEQSPPSSRRPARKLGRRHHHDQNTPTNERVSWVARPRNPCG